MAGCSKKILHLPNIPLETSYQNETYHLTGQIKDVDKEIGTTDDKRYRVYSIKNIDTKDSIAILVTSEMYQPIYYKATNK
jgi:hypothetical protein